MAANKHSVNYALEMRAQILCLLSQVELDTQQLADEMLIARSSILNHLSYLQGLGLVTFEHVKIDKCHNKQVHYATHIITDTIKAMQVIKYGIPPKNGGDNFSVINQLCAINGISTREYACLLAEQNKRIHQEGFNNHGKNHT